MSDLYCMKPPAGLYKNNIDLTNWVIQPKLDGFRCLFIPSGKSFDAISPNGKKLYNVEHIIRELIDRKIDFVIDGELLGNNWNETAHIVRASKKERDGSSIFLYCFDAINKEEFGSRKFKTIYATRYKKYTDCLDNLKTIICIKSKPAIDNEHVWEEAKKYLILGYEGAVIKDLNGLYKCGRSQCIQRLKFTETLDLKIEDLEEGEGKHIGRLGFVVCNLNGVLIRVGTGFSDEERKLVWNNKKKYIGMFIEIKYQEKTKDGSLRFPTFVRFRDDK